MGMKKSIIGMALGFHALAMMSQEEPKRTPPPQFKDPNEALGISIDYLDQYAMILNGTSKIGIHKQTRIKEKVEAYAERLIKYYELNPVTL